MKPDIKAEYIYLLDEVWTPNKLGGKPIEYGTIMINVKQSPNGGYTFNNKETGELLKTSYDWALAINTPTNIKRIDKYNIALEKYNIMENHVNLLRNNIKRLCDD